ncbi:MAG: 3-phosphoshikimate 1-carboxyvinyltransferase [Treponema sp.]|nr:3-phosphoshikimate 1-carboxyvinyltransferase [Treponema sp.]
MRALIRPRHYGGIIRIPASKSHTIRRLLLAALTDGTSEILLPLESLDTQSCIAVCKAMGAEITEQIIQPEAGSGARKIKWIVRGISPERRSQQKISCDVGNSGTTLYLALAAAALGSGTAEFDGDEQIRRRTAGPLLEALAGLGITVNSAAGGCAPISVRGPWKGGHVRLPCPTSQYLSALLLAAPLAPAGVVTDIDVPLLNEKPYIEMTLSYLKAQNIPVEISDDFSRFRIPGGSSYKPINGPVPGDFSSAAFPACAAMVCTAANESPTQKRQITLLGLDPADLQGDKAFFSMLEKMGCNVKWENAESGWQLKLTREGPLAGGEFDLNDTPDLLPVMAIMGSFAHGETRLVNVAHARLKETDRIAVMAAELQKLGVQITERPDGLVIKNEGRRPLSGKTVLEGRKDHRIVMALASAALAGPGTAEITDAESAAVTYPGFLESLHAEFEPFSAGA